MAEEKKVKGDKAEFFNKSGAPEDKY